eukprot:CAMPEP_0170572516 /NCGR_PEP_ID=MMETSP0224-20130122/2257_1 /TAXON_ID=285029 /ORGANISM="Togula jolla, Strain CCCM 725" /LENGTH=57 /DNA_ID=CAMNT_0010895009 /DNA_START=316 /DNA_END=489 /DNA_ORIENTATION=-
MREPGEEAQTQIDRPEEAPKEGQVHHFWVTLEFEGPIQRQVHHIGEEHDALDCQPRK